MTPLSAEIIRQRRAGQEADDRPAPTAGGPVHCSTVRDRRCRSLVSARQARRPSCARVAHLVPVTLASRATLPLRCCAGRALLPPQRGALLALLRAHWL